MQKPSRSPHILIWVGLFGLALVAANCGPSSDSGGRSTTPFDPDKNAGATNGQNGGGGKGASGSDKDGGTNSDANAFVIDFPDSLQVMDAPGTGDENKDTLEACGVTALVVERVPPDLMIVLDRSGSMMRTTQGQPRSAGETVRWDYTRLALSSVMTATDGDVAWGLKMYPTCKPGNNPNDPLECLPDSCASNGLLETPDLGKAAAFNTLILNNTPRMDVGATPTAPAVVDAVAVLKARNNGRPKYILLATDGDPNCGLDAAMVRKASVDDAQGAVAAVAEAKAAGIDVFVLGIAIKDPAATTDMGLLKAHRTLNMMADAGGRARIGDIKYYPATSETDINKAVTEIAAAAVSCTLPLAQNPPADASTRVDIDKVLVEENVTEGWSFGPNRSSVILNGTLCAKRKRGDLNKIIISFTCPGRIPPPPPVAL